MSLEREPTHLLAETLAEALCHSVGPGATNELLCRALGTQLLLDVLSAAGAPHTLGQLLAAVEAQVLTLGSIAPRLLGALRGVATMSPELELEEFARRYVARRSERRTG